MKASYRHLLTQCSKTVMNSHVLGKSLLVKIQKSGTCTQGYVFSSQEKGIRAAFQE